MEIVKNILKIVKERNITNKRLCELLGKNSSYITDWKNGKSKPKADEVWILADYFDCSVDYLLGRSSNEEITAHELECIKAYRANPAMQSAVDRLLGVPERTIGEDIKSNAEKAIDLMSKTTVPSSK